MKIGYSFMGMVYIDTRKHFDKLTNSNVAPPVAHLVDP